MKLRHSTICTLYSSEKHSFCRTKCIRRNMRSTCQWSCVLQFTRRRAVCCGLHRPMSQVIPCLGLKFKMFFNLISNLISTTHCFHILRMKRHEDMSKDYLSLAYVKRHKRLIVIGKLPWRKPLETNNITIVVKQWLVAMRVPRIFVFFLPLP